MKLDEYLIRNGVKLFINPLTPKGEPRQTNSLGAFDYAENLDNILGKHVWICDYRVNDKAVLIVFSDFSLVGKAKAFHIVLIFSRCPRRGSLLSAGEGEKAPFYRYRPNRQYRLPLQPRRFC